LADLPGTESSFIEGHDHGTVPGDPAVFDQGLDLLGCQELRCRLGLRIPSRSFDSPDLLLGKVRVLVLDHPEKEQFEDCHMIGEGVLLEWPAIVVLSVFNGLDSGIDCPYRKGSKFRKVTTPSQEGVGEFIGPLLTDPSGCPSLGNKFIEEPGIEGCDFSLIQIPRDMALGVVNPGLRKVLLCMSYGRHTKSCL